MKNYALILLAVFGISLISTPDISTAKESEINFDKTTEIESLPEIASISEVKIENIAENAEITTPVYTTPKYTSSKQASSTPTRATTTLNYTVTRKTQDIVAKPSNSDIYKTGKLVYAHNDPALMLSALSLRAGSVFTITEDGIVKTYKVVETKIYSKTELSEIIPGTKYNLMSKVTKAKNENNVAHSIALMTCYERTRSAEHRFVVFANEI